MKLAFNKNQTETFERKELSAELLECHKKQEFLMTSVRTLLQLIKEFAFDLKELASDAFKHDIDVLEDKFNSNEKLRKTQSSFHKQKKRIRRFVDQQKKYLEEREKELKDIIDLLGKAMVTLDTDNQEYNQKIYKQSEKIERITRLDDIKTDHTLSITVSIGVSAYRKGDTPGTITDRADQALYVAKRIGKNRVASENEIYAG